VLKSACWLFITEDLAISQKQTADYTVICVWAITPDKDLLLIARLRERLDNPEQQQQTELLYRQHHPRFVKIESVAYQLALIQQLRKKGLPIREYKPVKDKVSRASTAAVYYESGKVFHPKQAMWLPEWEEELLMFPLGAHDDQVDNASIACEELSGASMSSEDHLRAMQRRLESQQGRTR
jgi:predicted phage terminase large subunit-like protein